MEEKRRVLMLYSGGKDSMLSAAMLASQGYEVNLVHYNNGCSIGCENVKYGYEQLVQKFDSIKYLGVRRTDFLFRSIIKDFLNFPIDEIMKDYGHLTFSQFNCTSCRVAMYVASILLCKRYGFTFVADGARVSQKFALEQPCMLDLFDKLFKNHGIIFLTPVKELNDDYLEKNLLLSYGLVPKGFESQCLLGVPIPNGELSEETIQACVKLYNKYILPYINKLLIQYNNIDIPED